VWEKLQAIINKAPDGSKEQAMILMEIMYWARERGLWLEKGFWSLDGIFMQVQRDADQLLMDAAGQEIGH